jgi:hypothetical protein
VIAFWAVLTCPSKHLIFSIATTGYMFFGIYF